MSHKIAQELENRLSKKWKAHFKAFKAQGVDCFRIYHWDIPNAPLTLDCYGRSFVINTFFDSRDSGELRSQLIESASQWVKDRFERARVVVKERVSESGQTRYSKISSTPFYDTVSEGPLKFSIETNQSIDVGLFLDHRPLRKHLRSLPLKGKKVLNLFSYTGSLGVAAASSGAHTTNVDLSKKYLDWAQKNYEINDIPTKSHAFIEDDTLSFLKHCKNEYDIILLDPPSYSVSKKMQQSLQIEEDHPMLIQRCLELLSSKGTLFFSTNKRKFKLDSSLIPLAQEISHWTRPKDFKGRIPHFCYQFSR